MPFVSLKCFHGTDACEKVGAGPDEPNYIVFFNRKRTKSGPPPPPKCTILWSDEITIK